jgi:hypothetical protein
MVWNIKSKNINKRNFNSKEFNFNLIKSYFLFLSVSRFIFCNLPNVFSIFLLQLYLWIKDQNLDALQ